MKEWNEGMKEWMKGMKGIKEWLKGMKGIKEWMNKIFLQHFLQIPLIIIIYIVCI